MTTAAQASAKNLAMPVGRETPRSLAVAAIVMILFLIVAPFVLYPIFLMKALCFALFACAFNLLIGYVGLASFGHAARPNRPAGRNNSTMAMMTKITVLEASG